MEWDGVEVGKGTRGLDVEDRMLSVSNEDADSREWDGLVV